MSFHYHKPIPQGQYTGYIWYLDAERPEELKAQPFVRKADKTIVEAAFVDEKQEYSYLIRLVNGEECIYQYPLKDFFVQDKTYQFIQHFWLPKKKFTEKKIKMLEVWNAQTVQENGIELKTFKPLAWVFAGFV